MPVRQPCPAPSRSDATGSARTIAGSLIGLFLSSFGADGLVRVFGAIADQEPLQVDVTPDRMVLFFTMAIGLGTGILFGLVPAWQAYSLAPASSLRESHGAGETKSRRLFGKSLVVAQVALSAVLLTTGGLFAQHLSNLRHVGLGFDRDSVLLVSLNPRGSRLNAAQLTGRYRDLLDRLGAIPGVRSVTLSRIAPATGAGPPRIASTASSYQIVLRDERHAENVLGMLHLACCLTVLRCS